MTDFLRPEFTPGTLPTYIGYHLQIFGAGRAKISLQTVTNNKKHEFFAARPKKARAAYQRQKSRSLTTLPDHYAAVDQLLSDHPDAKVFRVHEKGSNNATADNAHVIASLEQEALWLVMSGVIHRWELTAILVQVLLEGKGKRTGEASIFNEYVPIQLFETPMNPLPKSRLEKGTPSRSCSCLESWRVGELESSPLSS